MTKAKPLMDCQFCYITNHILFSQLLYKIKNTPFSAYTCNSLNMAIRGLYKAKCFFTKTALNMIFHLSLFYNLNNLWMEQIAKFTTSILNQFNISTSCYMICYLSGSSISKH